MYEPIRTKSAVHHMDGGRTDYPHSSRGEALDIQLSGHLSALLAVTDGLGLDEAGDRIAEQVTRLRGARPTRLRQPRAENTAALHQRAHDLAARALLVAASRADTTAAILAAERMDAHAAALRSADADLAGAH
ncbi:hypothetical protein ABT144_16085 [Streptomyces sp. NPDC002039]|uniref:SCO4983 family protein n=1 Tax=Streptomyces sp. NPDC002039 TaxID=3154660 RepID=UPI0033178E4A